MFDLDSVKEAIVVARDHGGQGKRLVAYLVAVDQSKATVSNLRKELSEKLPDYMLPSAFVFLEQLPQTGRNKIDFRALPDPGRTRPDLDEPYSAPRTPTESALAQIWSEVLDVEPVGIHDNFFELGGHSLLAARVVSRIGAAFQFVMPLRALFDTPTIASLAKTIDDAPNKNIEPESIDLTKALKLLGYG